jgi:hypothetical protein
MYYVLGRYAMLPGTATYQAMSNAVNQGDYSLDKREWVVYIIAVDHP